MVVVPRTAVLADAEAALGFALVALVAGNRPAVSTGMVSEYLMNYFRLHASTFSVWHHDPEDFIVRFARQQDLEAVLQTVVLDPPFRLIWNRWRRTSLASAGSFQYRVLVGMRRVPLHARSLEVAQTILGTACAHLDIAPPGIAPEDDDREFFVAAWCLHPKFVPDEKVIFIPEPNPLVPGNALYVNAEEVVLNRLPGLRYLVRLRIIEIQDWSTPPPSEDEDGPSGRGADEDDDSDDINHNWRHPGLEDGGGRRRQHGPRSTRFAVAGDRAPHLGVHRGPTFMSRGSVLVGSVLCPLLCAAGLNRAVGTTAVDAGPGEAAPAEVLSVETGVKILVNSPDIAKLDDAEIIPSVQRNDDAMIVSILPADLSLLEKQIAVEPEVRCRA
jgi:hypothetical protein